MNNSHWQVTNETGHVNGWFSIFSRLLQTPTHSEELVNRVEIVLGVSLRSCLGASLSYENSQ